MHFRKPANSLFIGGLILIAPGMFSLYAQERITRGLTANQPTGGAQLRGLNDQLLRIHGQMQQISPDRWQPLREEASPVIAQRFAALSAMIQQNPTEALSFAFSPELAADLAAKFPGSVSSLETNGTWRGPVERWAFDSADWKSSREVLQMKIGQQIFEVHFAGLEPAGLKSGDVLQVTGVQVGNLLAAPGGTVESPELMTRTPGSHRNQTASIDRRFPTMATTSTSTTSACSNTGVQNTAMLLVTFPGVTLPSTVTAQSLDSIFFGTADHSMNGYLQETSYGQTWAAGNVFGPYTLTGTYTSCTDVSGPVFNDAIAAATASGVNLNNYSRVFLVFPDVFGCGWAGYAYVGGCSITSSSGAFNASTAFIAAGAISSNDAGVDLASHEIGHNFGIGHAQLRAYSTQALGALTDAGTLTEYGDHFSVMSAGNLGHFAAPHKQMLGWIDTTQYQTVTTSGTYTISPLETNLAGVKALQVQRGGGNTGYYVWVEYRQPIGYDSTLSSINPQVFGGALIHYQDSTTVNRTQLLDYTAPATYYNNPDLAPGSTWTDPYSNLAITVLSATASGLTVNINYGSMPCTPANPTVSLSPSDPTVYPGQSASYTVSVIDNDTSGCPASTFVLSSAQPSWFPVSLSATALTFGPGQSGTVTLAVAVPTGTAPATYPLSAIAVNGTYAGSASANITVATAPVLTDSLSVPISTYVRGQTVSMTATVMNGTAPVSGASVAFTLTKANGRNLTGKSTTGSTGKATWSYTLRKNDPAGSYSAVSQTQTVNSNTVALTVQ